MVSYGGLTREIDGIKRRLVKKAKEKGLYENFGQTEIRKLRDKYNYNDLVYGTPKQRKYASKIDELNEWASNYNDGNIR